MNRRTVTASVSHGATTIAVVALAVALLGTAGCEAFRGATPVEPPTSPVGIVGEIKSIERSQGDGVWGAMLVEGGEQPAGAVSDKAMVRIAEETLIARAGRWIPPDDLAVGMNVRVWFEGAVAESYPVQGTAGFIEVQ